MDLADQVDEALVALRRGHSAPLDTLLKGIDESTADASAPAAGELYRGLRRAAENEQFGLPPGTSFDGYVIEREVGRGGMGLVYAAWQQRPRRRVALKLIRAALASDGLARRFEYEVQLLGRLQHAGIAQIYDAGVATTPAGPQPYFTMELVDGLRLTDFAAAKALDKRARLELFGKVCEAVQHAHQKGIIHRDLKPANILVGPSGQPKILDFGVARAIEADPTDATQHTLAGQLIGTLAYMSPEHVADNPHEIDTRSDVYALGVILFELLCGRLPYDVSNCSLPEAARRIRDYAPTRLGTVDRTWRGEFEWVVARALEKDKSRRYQSAGDLAGDIRRYLNHQPLALRQGERGYFFRKWLARHKLAVAVAGMFMLVLTGGLVTSTVLWRSAASALRVAESNRVRAVNEEQKASRHAADARQEAERTKAIADLLARALAPPEGPRSRYTLKQRLDRFLAELEAAPPADPAVEAGVRQILARTYSILRESQRGCEQAQRALEILRGIRPETDSAVMDSLIQCSYCAGDPPSSVQFARDALDLVVRAAGESHPAVADRLGLLGGALFGAGEYVEAEAVLRRALLLRAETIGDENFGQVLDFARLSGLCAQTDRFEEAKALFHQGLAAMRRLTPSEKADDRLRWTYWGVTALLARRHLAHDAIALLDQLEAFDREVHGPRSGQAAAWLGYKAAYSAWIIGREALAVADARLALEIRREVLGPENVLPSHFDLGKACMLAGRWQEACDNFKVVENDWPRWIEGFEAPHLIGDACGMHAVALRELGGDLAEAEALARRSLAEYREVFGENHWVIALVLNEAAWFCRNRDGVLEAEALEDQAAEVRRQTEMWDQRVYVDRLEFVAEALLDTGRFEHAEQMLRDCVRCRAWMPPGHWAPQRSAVLLSQALMGQGKLTDAESILIPAVQGLSSNPDAPEAHRQAAIEAAKKFYELRSVSEPD